MEHAAYLAQFLAPLLLAVNLWFVRQAIAAGRALLKENRDQHARFEEALQSHERRLARMEAWRDFRGRE